MTLASVVFAHGLEGTPDGRKPRALQEAGLDVTAPDGRHQTLEQRLVGLSQALDARPGSVLVGSSYGGLAVAWLASRRPADVSGLLLLAPALSLRERPADEPDRIVIPASVPGFVIHGLRDDVVPIDVSRALVHRCPHLRLVAADDDHALHGSLALIVEHALKLASGAS